MPSSPTRAPSRELWNEKSAASAWATAAAPVPAAARSSDSRSASRQSSARRPLGAEIDAYPSVNIA
jgi:hypothetical protein